MNEVIKQDLIWHNIENELPKDNGRLQRFWVIVDRSSVTEGKYSFDLAYFWDGHFEYQVNMDEEDRDNILYWAEIHIPFEILI